MCCGRPSSRPYSYAVERCGDLQDIINDCPCSRIVGIDIIYNALSMINPTATRWSVGVIYNALSMIVHAGNVGASGSSPALRSPAWVHVGRYPRRGWIAFPLCMCCGRPSSRPYSYAVERCGDLQCIIMDCRCSRIVGIGAIFNALSMTVHTGGVGASGSSPALSTRWKRCMWCVAAGTILTGECEIC